jgi:tRNA(His) guanylyltransferase
MKFDDLDQKMRVFETAADYCVLPGMFMVARLDGRGFTRLTKEVCRFEAPFDERFRDLMVETASGLMNCGFRVIYAYTESDEISLLFDPEGAGLVVDYFRWRNEDAARNALNAYCYWTSRQQGLDERASTELVLGLSTSQKNELLFDRGINFNDVPSWQKRGVGLYWECFDKPGRNPVTGQQVVARRRRIKRDMDLPMKDEYGRFLEGLVNRRDA